MVATYDFYPMDPTIWVPIIVFSRVVVKWNVIFFNLLFFSYENFKISKNEWLKIKILPNLLTVDSDRANFPLHGGI